MTDFETIIYEQAGPRARITFNRPKVLNALNNKLISETLEVVKNLPDETRVLVLAGSGGKAFAAGADLQEMQKRTQWSEISFGKRRELAHLLETSPFPTIAAIEGFALGGGLELALACNLRFASSSAQLGLPETSLGILPANGGTARLARLTGRGRALRMVMMAERVSATEAERIGLVDWVVEASEFAQELSRLEDRIIRLAPIATRAVIDTVSKSTDMSLERAIDYEHRWFQILLASADKQEGVSAFLQKRKPEFSGIPDNEMNQSAGQEKA